MVITNVAIAAWAYSGSPSTRKTRDCMSMKQQLAQRADHDAFLATP
jgi:hypothetical protein